MARIFVDLDGVLCRRPAALEQLGVEKYAHAVPQRAWIERVNALKDAGHDVTIYTARGTTTARTDADRERLRAITEHSLAAWGVRYDHLRMDKPAFDLLIDDRAVDSRDVVDVAALLERPSEEFA